MEPDWASPLGRPDTDFPALKAPCASKLAYSREGIPYSRIRRHPESPGCFREMLLGPDWATPLEVPDVDFPNPVFPGRQ